MSADASGATPPEERITLDDLRHKAMAIRDAAKQEARSALQDNTVRVVIVSAAVFAVTISVAYFLGSRAARAASRRETPPYPPSY